MESGENKTKAKYFFNNYLTRNIVIVIIVLDN